MFQDRVPLRKFGSYSVGGDADTAVLTTIEKGGTATEEREVADLEKS
jgi:hypothetical protein